MDVKQTIIVNGMKCQATCSVVDQHETETVRRQLAEDFVEPTARDRETDRMLAERGAPETDEDEIEDLAHAVRLDYLSRVEVSSPDAMVKAVAGDPEYADIARLIEKEDAYAAGKDEM